MKHLITLSTILFFLISCKKDGTIPNEENGYLKKVQLALKDSMTPGTFESLNFSKAIRSKVNGDTVYLRIPFTNKLLQNEFLLLSTDNSGSIKKGRLISLVQQKDAARRMTKYRSFNGYIILRDLKEKLIVESEIINGYITAIRKPKRTHREALVAPSLPYGELPEVIVVGYLPSAGGGGQSFTSCISYTGILGISSDQDYGFGGGGGVSNYYGSLDGSGYGEVYIEYGYNDLLNNDEPQEAQSQIEGYVYDEPPFLVDYEASVFNPAIDILKYLECFASIPDAGATCSIEIFADIPVDSDPNKLFNFETGSPGHTFIQIKKKNGDKSASQNIGFYPVSGWKNGLTTAPMDGKFVDNEGHEFNASILMDLNPRDFNSTLTEISRLSNFIRYDVDNYNCTDFALDVFNATRVDKIEIPLYDIPGNYPSVGTRTPQGLFHTLRNMKNSGSPEASNITTGIYKGWVGHSSGPCN